MNGLLNAICRKAVWSRLNSLKFGALRVIEEGRSQWFGDDSSDMDVTLYVEDPRFYRRAVLGGGLGVAEALLAGEVRCDDWTGFVRLFTRNLELTDRMDRGWGWCRSRLARVRHWLRRNTRRNASQNIHEHYDLGNEFFALFLDESLTYSAGVFEQPGATMEEASLAKIDRACRKLALRPEDHLLEIGTGWGALSIYAARHFGCRVTTATISREQFELATRRVAEAGLSDRIDVQMCDYRDLTGQYDKIVSVEMIEAVGHSFLETFFRQCSRLLRPDGLMLLQAIVIRDQRYRDHLRCVDFIRRYVFPGGSLPSIGALLTASTSATEMRLLHLEDIAPHYAESLRRWRAVFLQRLPEVRELGFSERFIRLWDYYLCYCEAVFEERQVNTVQMLYAQPGCRFDPSTAELRGETERSWERTLRGPALAEPGVSLTLNPRLIAVTPTGPTGVKSTAK